MNELIGKVCRIEFDMDATQWPIAGFPAWAVVIGIDTPLIKLQPRWGGSPFWFNVTKILRIEAVE